MTSFTPTRRDKRKIAIAATWINYVMNDQLHPYKRDNRKKTIAATWVSYVMSDQPHPYKKRQEEDNNNSLMEELCDE